MAIMKNPIPVLEYDTSPCAVIEPEHERLEIAIPEKVIFAFLGDAIDSFAKAHNARVVGEYVSIAQIYPIYQIEHNGESIGLCRAPVGAAAAAQILDWLIAYGARTIVTAGSCGALVDLPENAFLVPVKALRDEGTSYHYLPPSRFVELDNEATQSIERTLARLGVPYAECTTWTTDGFFRETRDKVEYRRSEGCSVVEMECAALAACAEFRKVRFGQLLYTADLLANAELYDERDWGADSVEKALMLCLEIISEM